MNDFQDKAFKGWTSPTEPVFKRLGGGRFVGLSVYRALSLKGSYPVWACSYSRRRGNEPILETEDYTAQEREEAVEQMNKAMRRIGDKNRQRCFRTGKVFLIERALNDLEIAKLPKNWPQVLSPGLNTPWEVLWSTVEECPSSQPCANPGWMEHPEEPTLRVLVDCGECPSCLARAQVIDRETGGGTGPMSGL